MKLVEDRLDAALEAGYPGVVVLAADAGSTWEKAVGVADLRTGAPMTTEHRFPIASVTKLFAATVVLQLVDEGELQLDGEVDSIEGGVTVRQLLNHTSGLPHFLEIEELLEPLQADRAHRSGLTPRDALALLETKPRLSKPGEGWFYTGSNYVVLGVLVEDTTGTPLHEELRRRIIEPLGLESTDLPDHPWTSPGLARGYLAADNPVLPDPGPGPIDATELDLFSWGGGGMVSTARDVARFLQTLLGGELLPTALREEMLTTVASDWPESDAYGLGIEEVTAVMGPESTCGSAWGHLGFSLGHTTVALASETGDRQVVVLANASVVTEEMGAALGELTWACYCGGFPAGKP